MDNISTIHKIVKCLLNDCEAKNLLKPLDSSIKDVLKSLQSRFTNLELASKADQAIDRHRKVLSKTDQESFIPEIEWNNWIISNFICSVKTNTEELKNYFKAILDPSKIDPEVTEFGSYMVKIFNELKYDKEKQKELKKCLFVEMRNAFNHNDYEICRNTIVYHDKNKSEQTIKFEDFGMYLMSINEVREVINEKIQIMINSNGNQQDS